MLVLRTQTDSRRSAECKRERFHLPVEELDLEQSLDDRGGLPDQLVYPLRIDGPVALLIEVAAVPEPGACPSIALESGRRCLLSMDP
jgi:hypothetical protein